MDHQGCDRTTPVEPGTAGFICPPHPNRISPVLAAGISTVQRYYKVQRSRGIVCAAEPAGLTVIKAKSLQHLFSMFIAEN